MSITHFLYWTLELDPKPLDTHCAIRKNVLLMWVQFKVQNWSLSFWSLGLCLKWPLMKWSYVKRTTIVVGKIEKMPNRFEIDDQLLYEALIFDVN